MTLWLVAVIPTRLPARERASRSSARPCSVLPEPGGPWIGEDRSRRAQRPAVAPPRGRSRRRSRSGRAGRLTDPRRLARSAGRGPARCGPAASIPCSATHSPSSSSAAWCCRPAIQPSGTTRLAGAGRRRRARCPRSGRPGRSRRSSPTAQLNGLPSGLGLALRRGRRPSPRPRSYVLVREPVSPGLLALSTSHRQARRGSRPPIGVVLVDELLGRQVHQSVELPPHRLVLAAMPAEELGEQPAAPAARASGRRVVGHDRRVREPLDERLHAGLRLGQVGRQLGVARDRPRDARARSASASSVRRPSSQSRSRRLLTTSSRL